MKIRLAIVMAGAVAATLALTIASSSRAADWIEGKNYFLVTPARPTSVGPGKVEVTEVFSYACPACNVFLPTMHKLIKALPANAVVTYLPAAFNTAEDWPMFRLAFCTAQALGVAAQTHDAMFDAVWTSDELAVIDPVTHGIKSHLPTIEDAAHFYNKHAGVPVEKFLSTSKSFAVDLKVRSAEDAVIAFQVDRTPTIIVNGKYRLQTESAGGYDQLVDLVKYLVAKESK
jgi:thiol:disulfide interchange protein DsbA